MRRFALSGLTALILLSGCSRDISGSYVAKDDSGLCWLQLVRTPDNHLSAQLVSSVLKPEGGINRETVSLTGAVEGDTVTLAGGGFLGVGSTALSGKFNGNSLTLIGVQSVPFTLKRSSLAEYQSDLSELDARSQAMVTAKKAAIARQMAIQKQRDLVAGINQLISHMERFEAEADVHLGRLPGAEKRYEAITSKVTEYISRERSLARNPNASNARAQLLNSATEASYVADQMHYNATTLQSSLEGNIAPLETEEQSFQNTCNSLDATQNDLEASRAACARLKSAAPAFREKYAAMSAGLSHVEEAYKREKQTQDTLIEQGRNFE